MASSRKNSAQNQDQVAAAFEGEGKPVAAPDQAPSGFQVGGTPEIDGWYEPQVGVAIQGQIVGLLEHNDRRGELRQSLLVELHYPTMGKLQGGSDVPLVAGQVLAVGMRHQLREALLYVEHKGEMWLKPKSKKTLPEGNTMWVFDMAFKGKKAPLIRQRPSAPVDDSVPNF